MATWNFISTEDFTGEIMIVGLENPNSGACELLCEMIAKYEPIYLTKLLGYEFYTEMVKQVDLDPDNVIQELVDLIDGVDFTYDGELHHWEGFRHHTAEYIYYWYMRTDKPSTTAYGQFIPTISTGNIVPVYQKEQDAYNRSQLGLQRGRIYTSTATYTFTPVKPASGFICYDVMNPFGL
jgi:hypothetical protein